MFTLIALFRILREWRVVRTMFVRKYWALEHNVPGISPFVGGLFAAAFTIMLLRVLRFRFFGRLAPPSDPPAAAPDPAFIECNLVDAISDLQKLKLGMYEWKPTGEGGLAFLNRNGVFIRILADGRFAWEAGLFNLRGEGNANDVLEFTPGEAFARAKLRAINAALAELVRKRDELAQAAATA